MAHLQYNINVSNNSLKEQNTCQGVNLEKAITLRRNYIKKAKDENLEVLKSSGLNTCFTKITDNMLSGSSSQSELSME